MPLDPQSQWVLDLVKQSGRPSLDSLSPPQARAQFDETIIALDAKPAPMAAVEDKAAPGPHGPIPIRVYTPQGLGAGAAPLLVYVHGGGWVIGGLKSYDALCRALAAKSGCKVASVDYRLAPEHKFPAAVDDAWAALQWIAANAAPLGVDPQRIALGGDSAGGNLTAVLSHLAREAGGPKLAFQLLIYPSTDMRGGTESHRALSDGYLLTTPLIQWFVSHYLRSDADAADPRASPGLTRNLENLPPALVITAGFDPLRDEGIDYAKRLMAAGVRTTLSHYPGMLHGFLNMSGALDEAKRAVNEAASALAAALSKPA
ncbi:MAG TPA: alpha/beta hydrolase [Candidatus Cybelea sp.]|nr:alpha/beta hydrolase [Candidatus Cybelea sp.]